MAYKKFNLYEGVKISERLISLVIVLSLVALAVIIIASAKPGSAKEDFDKEIRALTENKQPLSPPNIKNTQDLIK